MPRGRLLLADSLDQRLVLRRPMHTVMDLVVTLDARDQLILQRFNSCWIYNKFALSQRVREISSAGAFI